MKQFMRIRTLLLILLGGATLWYAARVIAPLASQKEQIAFIIEAPRQPANNIPDNISQEQIVITANGERAGFVNWNSYLSDPKLAGLYYLYIEKKHRRKGYAKKLLTYVSDYLANKGYTDIILLPGPLEFVNDDSRGESINLTGQELEKKMVDLLRLYASVGFKKDPYNPANLRKSLIKR